MSVERSSQPQGRLEIIPSSKKPVRPTTKASHTPYRPVRQLWADRRVLGYCDWENNLILLPNGVKIINPALCTPVSIDP